MPADISPSSLLNATRIAAQLAVGEQPSCPPGYCAGLATCPDRLCPGHPDPDAPLATPEEAEGWTASVGYYLIAGLAFIAFLLVTLMVAGSVKGL